MPVNNPINFKAMTITTAPTAQQIELLKIGDIVPNVFGKLSPVTKITHKGTDINGKKFACFYTQFSDSATMSGSIKEGEELLILNPIH